MHKIVCQNIISLQGIEVSSIIYLLSSVIFARSKIKAQKPCMKIARRTGWKNGPDILLTNKCPFNSPKFNPVDYHVSENIRGLSQVYCQKQNNRGTQGNAGRDSRTQGHRQSCKRVFKATVLWLWWILLMFTVTTMLCYFVHQLELNDVILLCDCLD